MPTVSVHSDPLDNWHWRNPLPQGNPIGAVAYGDQTWVAVYSYSDWSQSLGQVFRSVSMVSRDLTHWESAVSPASLHNIRFLNGQFFAVAFEKIYASTNGLDWTNAGTLTNRSLGSLAYGKGNFIVVGYGGFAMSSPDLAVWKETDATTGGLALQDVSFGSGIFVAVGDGGVILTSPDGLRWSRVSSGTTNSLSEISFAQEMFIAVGGRGTILTSLDGVTWSNRASNTPFDLTAISYGQNRFVVVGYGGSVLISTNGTAWLSQDSGSSDGLFDVAFGGSDFVAIGDKGTILSSSDGGTWNRRSSGPLNWFNGAAFGNGVFVTVGFNPADYSTHLDQAEIYTSGDGVYWSKAFSYPDPLRPSQLNSVVFAADRFVAVGNTSSDTRSFSVTSVNGHDWTVNDLKTPYVLKDLAFGNGLFVAVGLAGKIVSSPDGIDWASQNSGTNAAFNSVTFGNNLFLAVGFPAGIFKSSDGTNWSSVASAYTPSGVAYGNGTFVAVGPGLITSINGIDWIPQSAGLPGAWLGSVKFEGGMFVATGIEGTVATSFDGTRWLPRSSGTQRPLSDAAYGQGTMIIVGSFGTILQSDVLLRLAIASPSAPLIDLYGLIGRQCRIEFRPNWDGAILWQPLATITLTNGHAQWTNLNAANASSEYYRAVLIP